MRARGEYRRQIRGRVHIHLTASTWKNEVDNYLLNLPIARVLAIVLVERKVIAIVWRPGNSGCALAWVWVHHMER